MIKQAVSHFPIEKLVEYYQLTKLVKIDAPFIQGQEKLNLSLFHAAGPADKMILYFNCQQLMFLTGRCFFIGKNTSHNPDINKIAWLARRHHEFILTHHLSGEQYVSLPLDIDADQPENICIKHPRLNKPQLISDKNLPIKFCQSNKFLRISYLQEKYNPNCLHPFFTFCDLAAAFVYSRLYIGRLVSGQYHWLSWNDDFIQTTDRHVLLYL